MKARRCQTVLFTLFVHVNKCFKDEGFGGRHPLIQRYFFTSNTPQNRGLANHQSRSPVKSVPRWLRFEDSIKSNHFTQPTAQKYTFFVVCCHQKLRKCPRILSGKTKDRWTSSFQKQTLKSMPRRFHDWLCFPSIRVQRFFLRTFTVRRPR